MITIRPLKPEEWQVFQKLNNEVFEDNAMYDPDLLTDYAFKDVGINYYKEQLNDPNAITFVAEEDGTAVGYIAVTPRHFSYRKMKYAEIDNMGVSPSHRSKGVGSMLIEKVKEWAREKGFVRLFVSTYWGSEKARAFYKKNGGKEIDVSFDIDL